MSVQQNVHQATGDILVRASMAFSLPSVSSRLSKRDRIEEL